MSLQVILEKNIIYFYLGKPQKSYFLNSRGVKRLPLKEKRFKLFWKPLRKELFFVASLSDLGLRLRRFKLILRRFHKNMASNANSTLTPYLMASVYLAQTTW